MRKRGLLGVLSTIAVGVAISAAGTSAAQAQNLNDDEDIRVMTEAFPADILELCGKIMDLKTVADFEDNAFAMAAYNNESDQCHEFALRWYSLLDDGDDQTGAISDELGDGNTGYVFG